MKVWCQWSDIAIPQGWQLISTPLEELSDADLASIDVYIPLYMSGSKGAHYITRMPRLSVVQLLMAGFDDALPMMRDGVTLCNARGVHDYSTAELAIAFMLAHFRHFSESSENQRAQTWNHQRTGSLAEKRIGIVGAGSIATTLKNLLAPFPVEIELFGRTQRDGVYAISSLMQRLPALDVVVLLVPLTEQTRGLIGADELSAMKTGSLLINVARGPVVDSAALIAELKKNRICAALDVTDPEPLPSDSPLWSLKNCQITPHIGGDSTSFEPRGRKLIEEQLQRIAEGQPLLNIIDWSSR